MTYRFDAREEQHHGERHGGEDEEAHRGVQSALVAAEVPRDDVRGSIAHAQVVVTVATEVEVQRNAITAIEMATAMGTSTETAATMACMHLHKRTYNVRRTVATPTICVRYDPNECTTSGLEDDGVLDGIADADARMELLANGDQRRRIHAACVRKRKSQCQRLRSEEENGSDEGNTKRNKKQEIAKATK